MSAAPCSSVILADVDAFFVSVETALRPDLAGGACAVVGGGRQVVLSASYRARDFGVTAGMPAGHARRACPGLVLLPARMDAYRACSERLFSFPRSAGGVLEKVSIDEAYWDVSGCAPTRWDLPGGRPGLGAGRWFQALALSRFGLSVSVGLACSKSIAKIACERAKPAGLVAVPCGFEREFLDPLPVDVVPGVGPVIRQKLLSRSIVSVGDLARCEQAALARLLGGRLAHRLGSIARAQEQDPVQPAGPSKSVGAEVTSFEDAEDFLACDALFAQALSAALDRLSVRGGGARAVTVTHRTPAGRESSASLTLPDVTADRAVLSEAARGLHARLRPSRLRLVGVSFSRLSSSVQLVLRLDGTDDLPLPPPPSPPKLALGELAYRGMEFTHDAFGPGRVLYASVGGVAVDFQDRVRFLDPAVPLSPLVP